MDYEKDNLLSETRDNWRIGYAKKLLAFGVSEECRSALEKEFPELKESEDERIRKEIIRIVDIWTDSSPVVNGIPRETLLAYLEKQKEQKPSTPKYRVGEVMRTKQEAAEGITDGLPVIVSVDDNYYYCTNEKIPISEQDEYEFPPMNMRQPGKWSEEDENRFRNLIYLVERSNEGKGTKEGFVKFINRLKSLSPQPHWKPSEEQMEALKDAFRKDGGNEYRKVINSLYRDLQKLL